MLLITTIKALPAMARLKLAAIHAKVVSLRHHQPHWLHDGHECAHLAYFAAVFIEGHGVYASMGGVLLILGVFMMFFRGGDV